MIFWGRGQWLLCDHGDGGNGSCGRKEYFDVPGTCSSNIPKSNDVYDITFRCYMFLGRIARMIIKEIHPKFASVLDL